MVSDYRVDFSQQSRDALRRLDRSVVDRIRKKLLWLSKNFDSLMPEVLTGDPFKGLFKLRVGEYRVVYGVNRTDRVLVVHMIRHRSEAYKRP